MKKLIFWITLALLIGMPFKAEAFNSSTERAFSDNIRAADGKVIIGGANSGLDVMRDLEADKEGINKFGRSNNIDSGVDTDIYDGSDTTTEILIWVAPTQARTMNIASTSASDDGDPAGVGARTLRIYGLIDWDTPEIQEDIVMNGSTSVTTNQSYVMVHRMQVLTKGATSSNVGAITAVPTTDLGVTAKILAGAGCTQMAIYGISSLDTLYIGRLYANEVNVGTTDEAVIKLLVNPEPDSELTNFLTKHTFGVRGGGSSSFSIPYYVPKKVEGPAIVKVQANGDAANMDMSGGFDGIVVTDTSGFTALVASRKRQRQNLKILTTSDGRVIRTTQ